MLFTQGFRYAERDENTCLCGDSLNSSYRVNDVLCGSAGMDGFHLIYDTTLDAGFVIQQYIKLKRKLVLISVNGYIN